MGITEFTNVMRGILLVLDSLDARIDDLSQRVQAIEEAWDPHWRDSDDE